MAVLTNIQKKYLAQQFIEQGELVLCIGKSTPWEAPYSETLPQPEISSISSISDPIAYMVLGDGAQVNSRVTIAYAKLDPLGTVEYRGNTYSISTNPGENETEYTFVYIKALLIRDEDELPVNIAYRKIGIMTDVIGTFNSGGIALPGNITDAGRLLVIDYRVPVYRNVDQSEIIELVIPF